MMSKSCIARFRKATLPPSTTSRGRVRGAPRRAARTCAARQGRVAANLASTSESSATWAAPERSFAEDSIAPAAARSEAAASSRPAARAPAAAALHAHAAAVVAAETAASERDPPGRATDRDVAIVKRGGPRRARRCGLSQNGYGAGRGAAATGRRHGRGSMPPRPMWLERADRTSERRRRSRPQRRRRQNSKTAYRSRALQHGSRKENPRAGAQSDAGARGAPEQEHGASPSTAGGREKARPPEPVT